MEEKRIRRKKALGLVVLIILVGIGALKIGKALPTIGALDTPGQHQHIYVLHLACGRGYSCQQYSNGRFSRLQRL